MDMGAYVVVINADKVTVTGNKPNAKTYFRHVNGRPGSWKIETFNQLQKVRGPDGDMNRVGDGEGYATQRRQHHQQQRGERWQQCSAVCGAASA